MKPLRKSQAQFERAQAILPGGVNSPVRAFRAVGGKPPFILRGEGPYLFDIDGNRFIDYAGSFGPLILGHADLEVVEAVKEAAKRGLTFGATTEMELELADILVNAFPSIEKVRLVNSGTEATMSTLRLARAATGRDKIVKFDGCYHGHCDALLVKAGSGSLTFGVPDSAGVSAEIARTTLSLPYNDVDAVERVFDQEGSSIAAVIVEPIAGNMGLVPSSNVFLGALRRLTQRHHSLLIFDEVISGFRVAYGGAQTMYAIYPDLTCLGKVIGGGLPIGAYGGPKEIMDLLSPSGPVYQAGTLAGNPLATAAGIQTLAILSRPGIYNQLARRTEQLCASLKESARRANVPIHVASVASMFTVFFTNRDVKSYDDVKSCDTDAFSLYFNEMLKQGIYLPPSQFETNFVSTAHGPDHIEITVDASLRAFQLIA
jgi:glutamate-1-semialdehyde 2,1-aminomutase